jgi:hypothetical protein
MVNQDRHHANQDKDGEPNNPWLEKFHAEEKEWAAKMTELDARLTARMAERATNMAELEA